MTFGSLGATSMSSRRPPMLAGPIERKRKLARVGFAETLKLGSRAAAPRPCAKTGAASSGNERTGMTRRNTLCMMSVRWESTCDDHVGERPNMSAAHPHGESGMGDPDPPNVVDGPCVQRARLRSADPDDDPRVEGQRRASEERGAGENRDDRRLSRRPPRARISVAL